MAVDQVPWGGVPATGDKSAWSLVFGLFSEKKIPPVALLDLFQRGKVPVGDLDATQTPLDAFINYMVANSDLRPTRLPEPPPEALLENLLLLGADEAVGLALVLHGNDPFIFHRYPKEALLETALQRRWDTTAVFLLSHASCPSTEELTTHNPEMYAEGTLPWSHRLSQTSRWTLLDAWCKKPGFNPNTLDKDGRNPLFYVKTPQQLDYWINLGGSLKIKDELGQDLVAFWNDRNLNPKDLRDMVHRISSNEGEPLTTSSLATILMPHFEAIAEGRTPSGDLNWDTWAHMRFSVTEESVNERSLSKTLSLVDAIAYLCFHSDYAPQFSSWLQSNQLQLNPQWDGWWHWLSKNLGEVLEWIPGFSIDANQPGEGFLFRSLLDLVDLDNKKDLLSWRDEWDRTSHLDLKVSVRGWVRRIEGYLEWKEGLNSILFEQTRSLLRNRQDLERSDLDQLWLTSDWCKSEKSHDDFWVSALRDKGVSIRILKTLFELPDSDRPLGVEVSKECQSALFSALTQYVFVQKNNQDPAVSWIRQWIDANVPWKVTAEDRKWVVKESPLRNQGPLARQLMAHAIKSALLGS